MTTTKRPPKVNQAKQIKPKKKGELFSRLSPISVAFLFPTINPTSLSETKRNSRQPKKERARIHKPQAVISYQQEKTKQTKGVEKNEGTRGTKKEEGMEATSLKIMDGSWSLSRDGTRLRAMVRTSAHRIE